MDNGVLNSLQCTVVGSFSDSAITPVGYIPFLPENSVHVWSVCYEDLDRHAKVLSKLLSHEEQKTASSFRNPADIQKYILRHGVVRIILGNYTRQDPETVSFSTGKNGKPELDPKGNYSGVSFNLSHSRDMVLIGITRKHPIGVDVVKMDPSYTFHDTADYILTTAEKAFMKRCEPDLHYQAFFRIWAIKEALLKAAGGTLAMMKNIDISDIIKDTLCCRGYSVKCLDTHPSFTIWQFPYGLGHYGAIAVESGISHNKSRPY